MSIPFYIANDEEKVLVTLTKVIAKVFPKSQLFAASGGDEIWKIIKKENMKGIVIASAVMQGLNGWELLDKIRDNPALKDSYYFFVASAVDNDKNIKALQKGVDDFLKQPFSLDQLIAKLRAAERIVSMQTAMDEDKQHIEELQEDLQKSLDNMVEQVVEFIDLRMPEAKEKALRVQGAADWIMRKIDTFKDKEIANVTKAARLCYAGRLYLPDNMLNTPIMKSGIPTNETMKQVPAFTRKLLSKIKDYDDVVYILHHVYENFDGTGFPENKQSWQIPIGSRIIRVASDYEDLLIENRGNEGKALDGLYHENHRLYDFKVVSLFDQYVARTGINKEKEIPISTKEISEGMILTRNITTDSGLRLLSAGLTLNTESIAKIKEIKRSDPIIGDIYIRNKNM